MMTNKEIAEQLFISNLGRPWNGPSMVNAIAAALDAKDTQVSDAYWDSHAVQCGNCGVALLWRGGTAKTPRALSYPGESEDEALCGSCAGEDLRIAQQELDAKDTRIAELESQLESLREECYRNDGGTPNPTCNCAGDFTDGTPICQQCGLEKRL